MDLPPGIARLLDDFDAGRPAALARAVSIVENHRPGVNALLGVLRPRVGRARRIGIIAVDPTSPFTGGALLGDRIRMESIALDPGIFIRSMATRGSLGGLASAT